MTRAVEERCSEVLTPFLKGPSDEAIIVERRSVCVQRVPDHGAAMDRLRYTPGIPRAWKQVSPSTRTNVTAIYDNS